MCLCLCSDMHGIPSAFLAINDTMIISLVRVVVVVVDLYLFVLVSLDSHVFVLCLCRNPKREHNTMRLFLVLCDPWSSIGVSTRYVIG